MNPNTVDTPVIQIRPTKGWASLQLRALWEYRELLYFLAWRDIKVRYKQTVLGAAWAIIHPVATMLIFTIVFGRLAKIPSDNIPYPIFCFCALLPWNYFASAFSRSSGSLVNNAHLISKVYFPRLVIPISSLLSGLLDFAIAFLVLIGMMFYYHIVPTITILWLPVFMLMAIATALGVGLWLGALNVQYRDIGYLVPFLSQVWMYATPVVYPSSLIPEKWRLIYGLNPMAGVIEGFRWALIGRGTKPGPMFLVSALATIILLVSGAFYFRRMEKTFADII
jgi:lipopolysaccharide transport system permease protein